MKSEANMSSSNLSFNRLLLSHWDKFTEKVQSEVKDTRINGHELDLATIIAVARCLNIAFDNVYFTSLISFKAWCFCNSRSECSRSNSRERKGS